MRVETISRALNGLCHDSEMWQRLIELRVALDNVLASDEEACEHCGAIARCFEIGRVPILADRIASVFRGVQEREQHREAARRRAADRNRQRRCYVMRILKGRGGLGEINR
jgi:hypothetical protein